MLTLLAAKIKSVPALVLASYRDDEVHRSQQLRVVLGELAPGPGRIKLQPLSSDAVAELAGPAGLDPAELYRQTSGNPFFITEVLATGGVDIPDSVRDAVLAWAPRLSDAGRKLLAAVAEVPGRVELPLLEALAGDGINRLDECLASGMLVAGPADVAFRRRASSGL